MSLFLVDSILAFCLSIPVVMHYRIWPGEGTNYLMFGLIFAVLVTNIIISFNYQKTAKSRFITRIKLALVVASIFFSVIAASITAMIDRYKTAPEYNAHDIILQQEAAMRYLIVGKNPYAEDYFGTPVEKFNYSEMGAPAVNPALYHYVMPPFYLLFHFLFYYPSVHFLNFFDARLALIFCLLGMLYLIYKMFKNPRLANIAILITALSPAVVDYFIEGRSDYFAFFFLLLSLFLLDRKKRTLSAITFAFAVLSKQTVWFAVPLYILMMLVENKNNLHKLVSPAIAFIAVCLMLCAPFILWNSKAFFDSVILYVSGNSQTSYPVSGYGFGMIMYSLGIIKNIHDYFPFIIFQCAFGIPVIIITGKKFLKNPTVSGFLFGYGLTLLVFWYFSRYFNNSHIAFISSVFALSILKKADEDGLSTEK